MSEELVTYKGQVPMDEELASVVHALSQLGIVESYDEDGEAIYRLPDNPPPLQIELNSEQKKIVWNQVPGDTTAEKMNYVFSFLAGDCGDSLAENIGNQEAWDAGQNKNQPAWLEAA